MLAWLVAGGALVGAVVSLLRWGADHRWLSHLAEQVRADIEPFLRRKAAESGAARSAPTWTSRSAPEEIVTYSAALARELLAREVSGPLPTNTNELEMARTQPGLQR